METCIIMEAKTMSSKEQLNELVTPYLRKQKIQEGRKTLFKQTKDSKAKFCVAECKLYSVWQTSVQLKTNFLVVRAAQKWNTERQQIPFTRNIQVETKDI